VKTSFFRWAIGLGVILGAPLVMAAQPAAAAPGRFLSLALWARDDIAADVVVALRDPSATDITATCQRGAAINPDVDGWQCTSADDLVLEVSAGPGVAIDLLCTSPDAGSLASSTGQLSLAAAIGNTSCLIRATPPSHAAPVTPVDLGVLTPRGQGDIRFTLYDELGNDRVGECASTNSSMHCTPLPYGTYRFGTRSGSPMTQFVISCFVYSTTVGGGALSGIDAITLGPETLSVSCSAAAAAPHIDVSGTAQPVRLLGDDGTVTQCSVFDTVNWSCNVPSVGGYHLELSERAAQLPVSCPAVVGLAPIDPTAFAIVGAGIEWYSCEVVGGVPPTPTTIGGPTDSGAPSDTTDSAGPVPTTVAPQTLPATGTAAPLLPMSMLVLGLGMAASLLARRPVR
jgi:hypothetical protein